LRRVKALIARMVRLIPSLQAQAAAIALSEQASVTLGLLGLKTQFCVVGMLYRTGPDPLATRWRFADRATPGR
jgi:hypothetical protein